MTYKEKLSFLKSISPFASWQERTLEALASYLDVTELTPTQKITSEAQATQNLSIIVSGRFLLFKKDIASLNEILISSAGRGDIVGEQSFLSNSLDKHTCYAARNSIILQLTKENYIKLIRKHPSIAIELTSFTINKLTEKYKKQSLSSNLVLTFSESGENKYYKQFIHRIQPIISSESKSIFATQDEFKNYCGSGKISHSEQAGTFNEWIHQLEKEYQFVIFDIEKTKDEWSELVLNHTDKLIYVGHKESHSMLNKLEYYIEENKERYNIEKTLVLIHDDSSNKQTAAQWSQKRGTNDVVNIRNENFADYGRLIRILTGRSVGLVLSGGGARGFAHIGLFRALKELKINIDYIGGSSVGAGLGALYAMGKDHETIFEEFHRGFVNFNSINHYTLPFLSLCNGKAFHTALMNSYGDMDIEDLYYNFFCVSTNLTKNTTMIHDKGNLLNAIRSSASLPGILPPVINESGIFVDGGISNNLPVDIMREKITNGKIIAVHLSSEMPETGKEPFGHIQSGYKLAFNKYLNKDAVNVPNISDVIMSSMLLSSTHHDQQMKSDADFNIDINTSHYGLLQVKDAQNLVDYAYHECLKQFNKNYNRS